MSRTCYLSGGQVFSRAFTGDVSMEEGFQHFQEGWYVEVQSHRKALDPESEEMLKERFDGAETVHFKVSSYQSVASATN